MALSLESVQRKKAMKVRPKKAAGKKKTIRPWEDAQTEPKAQNSTSQKRKERPMPFANLMKYVHGPLVKILDSKDRMIHSKAAQFGYVYASTQLEKVLEKNPQLKSRVENLKVCAKLRQFAESLSAIERQIRTFNSQAE